jgi:flagellar protein FliO/FliZ
VKFPIALLAALTLFSLRVAADPAAAPSTVIYPGTPPAAESRHQPGGGISVTAAIFIIGCAGLGGWLWWKGRRGGPGSVRGDRRLAIAETRPLGNRQYLVVAAYDGKKFLLGVCPGRIDLLAPLDPGTPPAA